MRIANVPAGWAACGQKVLEQKCKQENEQMSSLRGDQKGRNMGVLGKDPEVTWYRVRMVVIWFRGR